MMEMLKANLEIILTMTVVAAAAAYLCRCSYKAWRKSGSGCSSCSSCSSSKPRHPQPPRKLTSASLTIQGKPLR